MNPQDHTQHTDENAYESSDAQSGHSCDEHSHQPSLARKLRFVSRLMRAQVQRELPAHIPPSRGEVKAAVREIEDRAASAVSPEDLATTLATLDRIAEALGGRDALPFHPRGHGRGHGHKRHGHGHGHGQRHAGRGHAGHDHGHTPHPQHLEI